MDWRLAESLIQLRKEVNANWPGRSRDSDGSIGDASHASRSSDHNPWIEDPPGVNVVSAIDLTHDPKVFNSYTFAELLRGQRDPRIKYIISNRKICSSEVSPWQWRPYNGANPHDHHVHISVRSEKVYYDDISTWNVGEAIPPKVDEPQPTPVPFTLRKGAVGANVKLLQMYLVSHGADLKLDGEFGPATLAALKHFQEHSGLGADGVAGPQTWKALQPTT